MPIVSVNIPSGAYSRIPKAVAGYNLTAESALGTGAYLATMLAIAINENASEWRVSKMNEAYEAMRVMSDGQFNVVVSGLGVGLV